MAKPVIELETNVRVLIFLHKYNSDLAQHADKVGLEATKEHCEKTILEIEDQLLILN